MTWEELEALAAVEPTDEVSEAARELVEMGRACLDAWADSVTTCPT